MTGKPTPVIMNLTFCYKIVTDQLIMIVALHLS